MKTDSFSFLEPDSARGPLRGEWGSPRGVGRLYCRLAPCNPDHSERPDVAGSRSFVTRWAYDRHLRRGHFLEPGAPGVPEPFVS